jgi:PAS domain S-box-containing protein
MPTPVALHLEGQSRHPTQPKSLPSVRTLLYRLIFACLLPAILVEGALLFYQYKAERTQLEQDALRSARATIRAVDEQLAQETLLARSLATRESLIRRDFSAFHELSLRLLGGINSDLSAALYDADGRQLLNTGVPFGQPLSTRTDLKPLRSVIATGKSPLPSLVFRLSDGRPVVRTLAPVYIDKKVAYVLAVGFASNRLSTLLSQLVLPSGAVASIIDSSGIVAARTLAGDALIGTKDRPDLLKALQLNGEGIIEVDSSQGIPLMAAYSRSSDSGWGVVIGIPRKTLDASLRQTFAIFSLSAVLILILSLSLAWLIGNRISKSVLSLRARATALDAGTLTNIPATYLSETADVSRAMEDSARRLTAQKQELMTANATLTERTKELAEAQHIAQTGSWKWDAKTGNHFASDELHQVYGSKIILPFAEQRGTLFPEADWQKLKTAVKATLQNKTGFSLLLLTLAEYDTPMWTRVIGEVVCNAAGEVTGLRGTLQDVDVDAKAEMALKVSEARLSLALSNSDLMLWDWRANTNALFIDARWATVLGVSVDQLPTTHEEFMQSVFVEDIPLIDAAMERHFRGETRKYGVNFRAHHKDGHLIWIHASGKIVERDAADVPVRVLGIILDASERTRQKAEIAQLQSELDLTLVWQVAQHTVAALAHEINQPLASASLLSEAAKRMLVTDGLSDEAKAVKTKRLEQTLERIASEIERAGETLKSLFKSLNKPDITQKATQVGGLITEAIKTAREEGFFGGKIITHFATDLPAVNVNRLQITKVLLNLIHNAAQALHEVPLTDGKIWISTALTDDGREVCVRVRDEGPGINASLQQEVFQPFITTKPNGLGMGLTISRALIEAHDGKLWHSQDDGRGATFHFTLPIQA